MSTPIDFLGGGPVLVVVAHPDDEVLGCGGTIRRLSNGGCEVAVLCVSDGVSSRSKGLSQDELENRRREAREAALILGVSELWFGDYPDNRLDEVGLLDLVQFIEKHLMKFEPTTVFTHFPGDLNIDHQRVGEAVVTASRPLPASTLKSVVFFETPSSTEWSINPCIASFKPNLFVDISNELDSKLHSLAAYGSEIRSWPHPRSLESVRDLARWRGSSSGLDAAESFVIGRQVV